MKIKLLILGLGLGASILAGCNDDFSSIEQVFSHMTIQLRYIWTRSRYKPLRCN